MLTDSHCHLDCLDLSSYGNEVSHAIAAARRKGVKYILCPGVSIEALPNILKIVETDADLLASIGVHPTEEKVHQPTLNEIVTLGQNKKVVGVGETGLDFYYAANDDERRRQTELFKLHIHAAQKLDKPLIVHARDADKETIGILVSEQAKTVGGVLHCFTGSLSLAEAAIDLGFYISFSGIITFRKAENLREIAKKIPLEKMLIETDAPYLAPTPLRGKPNEPAYLPYIAEFMAKLLEMSYESFASQTTENFLRFCRR
jgi:TatD DNase family protein